MINFFAHSKHYNFILKASNSLVLIATTVLKGSVLLEFRMHLCSQTSVFFNIIEWILDLIFMIYF